MVAPGNPYDYRCEGSNKLIKDGANPITNTEDILYLLENFSIKKNSDIFLNDKENSYHDKEEENHTPISIEDFSLDLKIPINVLNSKLIELEIEGKLVVENGSVYIK